MNYILFDGIVRNQLLPFTYTRPVADIRIGILTLREKWEKHLASTTGTITKDYLQEKFPKREQTLNIFINASFIPTEDLVNKVKGLKKNEALFYKDEPLAYYGGDSKNVGFKDYDIAQYASDALLRIQHTWDIFKLNAQAIALDFEILTKGKTSEPIPESVFCVNKEQIFIEEGASLNIASLNASNGPIYIGKNTTIMEYCTIRGPFALCEGATLKMAAKIYGPTTVGPYCKVGGEVNNSVFFANSNKAHDGFLGNAVIGEWCNLGADTNNSNLKNNYAEVRLWNYETQGFAKTGLQFCGMMMGDHSKCGINTMFNTGTVIGVSANIFGSGFPRNFIPSFSWGGSSGFTTYLTKKAFEVAKVVMKRRGVLFTDVDAEILNHVFEETKTWRRD